MTEYQNQWYQKNRERLLKKARNYREANLEDVREKDKEYARQRTAVDPEFAKLRQRGYALKRKYGITVEQYEELKARQNGCCALCDRHESEFKTNLAVDHDHVSLRIRGLLCTSCNYRLVARHRDGALLRKIADYVEQGTEWFAPEKKKRRPRKPRKVKA